MFRRQQAVLTLQAGLVCYHRMSSTERALQRWPTFSPSICARSVRGCQWLRLSLRAISYHGLPQTQCHAPCSPKNPRTQCPQHSGCAPHQQHCVQHRESRQFAARKHGKECALGVFLNNTRTRRLDFAYTIVFIVLNGAQGRN